MEALEPTLVERIWGLAQAVLLAISMGWIADRLADPSSRSWFAPVFAGIFGMYLGPRVAAGLGWAGPVVGTQSVAALFACALVACFVIKLFRIGIESVGRT